MSKLLLLHLAAHLLHLLLEHIRLPFSRVQRLQILLLTELVRLLILSLPIPLLLGELSLQTNPGLTLALQFLLLSSNPLLCAGLGLVVYLRLRSGCCRLVGAAPQRVYAAPRARMYFALPWPCASARW